MVSKLAPCDLLKLVPSKDFCSARNVIYLISCKKCNKQYVGQTSQQASKRMNSHKFDISNFKGPDFSTHVATHFNTDDDSFE